MAERTRSEKRQRRSQAREKRRSLAAKPFEELDEAADAEEREAPSRSPLRQAASTAVLGAVVAGVAGAAKALADRGPEKPQAEAGNTPSSEPERERSQGSAGEEDGEEPESREEEQTDGDDEEPQAAADVGDPESEDQGADDEEQPRVKPESGQGDEATEDEPQEPDDGADGSGGTPKGASTDEVKEIVDEAKRELQELLGTEPERVSGFHRSNGRWTVTLEVVNVRRVPDTTDVLSSYEVAFDDDRNLVSLSETRRYRRSQVEEG